jgi:hypothetical protein
MMLRCGHLRVEAPTRCSGRPRYAACALSLALAANCAAGRSTVRRTRETADDLSETEPHSPVPEGRRRGPEPRKATSCGKDPATERTARTPERRGRAPERRAPTPERRGHPPDRKDRARKRRSPETSPPSSMSEPTEPVTDARSRGPDAQVRGPCTKELATGANDRPRASNFPDSEHRDLTPDRRAPTPEPRVRARERKDKPDKTKSSQSEPRSPASERQYPDAGRESPGDRPRYSPSNPNQQPSVAKGSGEKRSLSTPSACSLPSFASESIPVHRSSPSDPHCPQHEEHDPKYELRVGA